MTADATEALARTALLVRRDIFPSLADEQIIDGLLATTVALHADDRALATPAGQTAIVATAIALAQSGAQVALDVVDAPLASDQPPLRGEYLATALREHLAQLPTFVDEPPAERVEFHVVFGDTMPSGPVVGPVLRVGADDVRATISSGARPAGALSGGLPFGAMLAACAVAAEAFKLAMRRLALVHESPPLAEHPLDAAEHIELAVAPVGLPPGTAGRIDVVSAGAITSGAMFALHRMPEVNLDVRIFDHDPLAVSNANRYPLYVARHVGVQKTEALAAGRTTSLRIEGVPERLTADNARRMAPFADLMLVGADDIPARWLAQRWAPGWVSVAGTSHFEIVVSEHVPEGPCAGCLHPRDAPDDGPIPTIAFVSMLAGVLQAHRLACRLAGQAPRPPVVGWPMALASPHGILRLGLSARADCPVGCNASRRVVA